METKDLEVRTHIIKRNGREVDFQKEKIVNAIRKANAEIAGIGDLTGSIETGKAADMVITSADPLRDFRALGDPALVVSRGELFDHPKVKRFKVVEEVLDRFMEQGRA